MPLHPWGALVIGCLAGLLSTIGFRLITVSIKIIRKKEENGMTLNLWGALIIVSPTCLFKYRLLLLLNVNRMLMKKIDMPFNLCRALVLNCFAGPLRHLVLDC